MATRRISSTDITTTASTTPSLAASPGTSSAGTAESTSAGRTAGRTTGWTAGRTTVRRASRFGGSADVLLAAALWGTTGTVQAFAPSSASPVSVGAARIVVGGFLLLALTALTTRTGRDNSRDTGRGAGLRRLVTAGGHPRRRRAWTWALLATGVLCVALYQTAFFAAVNRTGVATGTVVTIGSAPAFAGLLSRLTGAAPLPLRWFAATAGAVAGCAALIIGGQNAGVEPVGVTLALLAGLGYAVYASIAAHFITAGHDDRAVVAVLFGGAGLALLPVLLAGSPGWLLSWSGLLVAGYLGAVTTTLGYLFYARGLRTTPVAVATTLGLAEPAVAALLGIAVLDEHLGGTALAGLCLVAAGLLLLVAPARSRVRKERGSAARRRAGSPPGRASGSPLPRRAR